MTDEFLSLEKKAGELVFREGDAVDRAYIVEEGTIEISVQRGNGAVVLCELGPGSILGEMAVIDQATRTATARATRDCRLTVVTPHQIRDRIENSDAVVRSLLHILLKRYRAELARNRGFPVEAESALTDPTGISKMRLEIDLMQALKKGEVDVAYQPIYRLADKSIVGLEALVRWDHPERGAIPPMELVGLTEETNLFVPLGMYVLKTAIKDLAVFQSRTSNELFMSVNVSVKHTRDQEFLRNARDMCRTMDQDVANIMLEVTESSLVEIKQLREWVGAARSVGFKLCMDDFGTGYAGLQYLAGMSPDVIKIDQEFVIPLADNPRIVPVLRGVLQMAADLNVRVIAEGAENLKHVNLLTELGCDMAQGYELGRPQMRPQIEELLAGIQASTEQRRR